MLRSDGFNGKGGKGNYGWLQEVMYESRFDAACTGTMSCRTSCRNMMGRSKMIMYDEDEMPCVE